MSHKPLWYLMQAPNEVTDEALSDFSTLTVTDAAMGIDSDALDHQQRNTSVCFAPDGHWLGKIMYDVGRMANEVNKWNFDLSGHEKVQYAEYGPNQHYDWHIDTFWLANQSTDRKITVVCLLNDTSDFTGGEFQVRLYKEYTAPLVKGSLIAFPSFLEHRVIPVLTGLRKTATLWISGSSFK